MNIKWNAKGYTDNFDFVHVYGEALLDMVKAPEGSSVVDLGCGNGALSVKLAEKGYRITGVDASDEMLKTAAKLHPELKLVKGEAETFSLEEKADVIFSNAVFHWIDAERQPMLAANLARNLKQGGELVFEMGGKGCAESVHSCLEGEFAKRGLKYLRTFYFPSIGEHTPILEANGFLVESALLFDRPTAQKTENGLVDWINMFDTKPFEGMDDALKAEILASAERELKDQLCINGVWYIDYVRLRIKARRVR